MQKITAYEAQRIGYWFYNSIMRSMELTSGKTFDKSALCEVIHENPADVFAKEYKRHIEQDKARDNVVDKLISVFGDAVHEGLPALQARIKKEVLGEDVKDGCDNSSKSS